MTSQPDPKDGLRHDTVLRRRLLNLLIYCAQQGKVANGTTGAMDLLDSYDATVRALRVVPPEGREDAEALARRFHETYERLAPSFGYETRTESAVPWDAVPEKNRRLMVAVCAELLRASGAGTSKCICPDEPCGEGPCVSLTGMSEPRR